MEIKEATKNDLEIVYNLETACFLKTEAASFGSLKARLEVYSEGYDILYVDGKAIGYIGGLKNNTLELKDEMYHDSSLHCPLGRYQTIFSVCILPEFQGHGYATEALMALFDWCMEVSDLKYMILTIDCVNEASCKVAERAGFELFEKRYPINHKQPNMESDCYYYYRKYRR